MAIPIRAIYKQGQLQLLDPINLTDGEQVEVVIITEIDRFKEAFADILTKPLPSDYDEIEIDEEAIMRQIREDFKGQPPLSDDIIRERQEGP
jgi:predicted DNA-binding antitoxin AbrB/MazE fold protein